MHVLRPPPRRLRLLAALRRVHTGRPRRGRGGAGHGRPRADRPRRSLRRGEVRAGVPGGRDRADPRRRPRRRAERPPGRCCPPGPNPPAAQRGPGAPRCAGARASTRGFPASPSSRSAGSRGRPVPGAGWGRLCRLVSETHLRGERGIPVAARRRSRPMPSSLRILLPGIQPPAIRRSRRVRPSPAARGPRGPRRPARAGLRGRPRGARPAPRPRPRRPRPLARRAAARLARPSRWSATAAPRAARRASGTPRGCSAGPASTGCPRCSPTPSATPTRAGAATVDVLDAARRLVAARRAPRRPGQRRGLPQVRRPRCAEVAEEIARRPAGDGRPRGGRLLLARHRGAGRRGACSTRAPTSAWARSTCPSPTVARAAPSRRTPDAGAPRRAARRRSAAATRVPASRAARGHRAARRRARHRSPRLGYASYFLTVGDGRRPDPRAWGSGSRPAARAPAAWSTTCSASPGSTRSRHGLLMERFLSPLRRRAARHRRRRRVGPAHRGLRARSSTASAASGAPASR